MIRGSRNSLAKMLYDALIRPSSQGVDLEGDLSKAYSDIVSKVIKHEEVIGGVMGPPGTGKTKLFEKAFAEIVHNNLLDFNEKKLYVAPTNELVTEFLYRLTRNIGSLGSNELSQVLRGIRIYGYAIPPPYGDYDGQYIDGLSSILGMKRDDVKDLLKNMVYRGIQDAYIILSTDYQRVSSRAPPSFRYNYLLMIDEASKAPLYLPFIPTSDELRKSAKLGERALKGMVVVGDDRQAIALDPEYHGISGKDLLVLPQVRKVLEELNRNDLFTALNTTYRLPKPSEEPIGYGFYSDVGGLNSLKSFRDKLAEYGISIRQESNCRKLVGYDYVTNAITETLNQKVPILIFNTVSSNWNEEYEPVRVKLAVYSTLFIKCLFNDSVSIAVIAPYSKLKDGAKYSFLSLASKLGIGVGNVSFLTVQSMLGGEADIVISMLGKEWSGFKENDDYEGLTIYFREPEILNVQFSRHRLFHIIIGNVIRLRSKSAEFNRYIGERRSHGVNICQDINCNGIKWMEDTLTYLLQMAGIPNKVITGHKSVPHESKYCGDGACLYKIS